MVDNPYKSKNIRNIVDVVLMNSKLRGQFEKAAVQSDFLGDLIKKEKQPYRGLFDPDATLNLISPRVEETLKLACRQTGAITISPKTKLKVNIYNLFVGIFLPKYATETREPVSYQESKQLYFIRSMTFFACVQSSNLWNKYDVLLNHSLLTIDGPIKNEKDFLSFNI